MFDGRGPIYEQIAEAIRAEILSGALSEGDQVMSTTQYATTYRINPATAAKAFALLVDEGILRKQRGVGMFVEDGAHERLRAVRRDAFFTERVDPVLREALVLGISFEDLIAYLTRASKGASG
ncbi:GntR family transcriptional regulator [Cumulibacter soli]|uniref:GntR family transcriptional regulator n=1 Tax=Cumulibacter soli TaxID=2546344 RepID=UPI0010681636|nr:GntR family transcriptional regulator [Cumulibacter soli]